MSEILTGTPFVAPPPDDGAIGVTAIGTRVDYWHRQLGQTPVLNLPTDKARPATPATHFAWRSRQVENDLATRLHWFSQKEQVPFSIVLLSVFQLLLSRYTSQEDLVIGCTLGDFTVAGDTHPSPKQKAFLLRADLLGNPSFRNLVRQVYTGAAAGAAQGSYSLAELMEELSSGLGVQAPTFQVSFSYRSENSELESGLASNQIATPEVPVDLHLDIDSTDAGLRLRLLYNQDLFEAGSIDRTLQNIETLLQGVAQNPGQHLSDVPILTDEEERQILAEWSGNVQDYGRDSCLHQLVEAQAERNPELAAVICGDRQLTYREFNQRANQVAHYLRRHGVGPNLRVAICLEATFEFAISVLAVLKSGGACVPLDPKYPQERLAYMLEDVQARVLITEKGMLTSEAPDGCLILMMADMAEVLGGEPRSNPESVATPHHTAYVIYTSGSTGKPRGVLLAHAGLANYVTVMSRMFGLGPNDRMLQFCSISFDIAVEEIFTTWVSGATLVLRQPEMPLAVPEFVDWVERQQITILDLPTAYWHEWVHHFPEMKRPVPRSVRLVIVGGERATAKACSAWSQATGGRVRWINTYGPTEASISVTAFELKPGKNPTPENIPIGRPVPNCRVYLLDKHLNPVPIGIPGELHIGGVCVAQGYHNRPELTREKFIPDPFSTTPDARLYKTGDTARYLPSGEIEFLGRVDDQVKIRGFRVELGEIEATLTKHPDVREVAVIVREDKAGDKRLVAYLVAVLGAKPTATALRHYLQQQLPDYMVPSTFVVLEAMPLTPNGKINRRGLPAAEVEARLDETAAATDAFQAQLVEIWEQVLARKPIGIRDNFFELGGHSLLAARLMQRIGKAVGKTLPLAMLFQAPTIEQLAATLRQDGWSHHWSSLVPIQPAGSHAPFFCIHGVGGNVVGFYELGRRLAPDHPFYGLQSRGLDGKHPSHPTIEEMATHYLDEIRTVQPRGPYCVGGFSFGGLVAYEMAQQLLARGEQVGLLVLFDTYPGDLKSVSASLVSLLLRPSWRHLSYDLPKAIRKRIRRTFRGWRMPHHLSEVRDSNRAAADRYVLRPYSGRATLVRAVEQSLRSGSDDPHAAWKSLVTNLEVHSIPGNHYEILVEPQVERLAACLKACIDRVSQLAA